MAKSQVSPLGLHDAAVLNDIPYKKGIHVCPENNFFLKKGAQKG